LEQHSLWHNQGNFFRRSQIHYQLYLCRLFNGKLSRLPQVLELRVKVLSEGHIVVSVFGSGGTLGQALKEFKRIFNHLVQFGHLVVSGT
jgi:hypothetical protein